MADERIGPEWLEARMLVLESLEDLRDMTRSNAGRVGELRVLVGTLQAEVESIKSEKRREAARNVGLGALGGTGLVGVIELVRMLLDALT